MVRTYTLSFGFEISADVFASAAFTRLTVIGASFGRADFRTPSRLLFIPLSTTVIESKRGDLKRSSAKKTAGFLKRARIPPI